MKKTKYLLFIVVFIVPAVLSLSQTVPGLINYQGRLTGPGGQPPADGSTVDLTFAFYGAESGATPLYLSVLQEDVVVTGGIYHVLIGSGTINPGLETSLAEVFQKHPDVWMGIKVNADAEMTPRARISSAPYSLAVDLSAVYSAASADPDFDGDGYVTALLGGLDCNDGDSTINPEGVDLSVDGIDQNCSGRDGDNGRVYLFSSQGAYSGELLGENGRGRYGADRICRADKASYPDIPAGHVHAFLSAEWNLEAPGSVNGDCLYNMPNFYPDEGVPTDIPIVGPTGIKIADNWADLMDGSIDTSLQAAQVLDGYWWSGSDYEGTIWDNCDGFTKNYSIVGVVGNASSTNDGWIFYDFPGCSSYNKVLCIAW